MKGYKQVWVPEKLHERIKMECKDTKPRTNLMDRVEQLIEKGYALEQVTNGKSASK